MTQVEVKDGSVQIAAEEGLDSGYVLKREQFTDSKSGPQESAFVTSFPGDSNSA